MRPLLAALLVWVGLVGGAVAHDVGVSEASLVEGVAGRYVLMAAVPQALAHLIQAPALPARCAFEDDGLVRRGLEAVRFGFVCAGRLTADDVLVLPWLREGIVLRATWLGGATTQRFFPSRGGVVTVALSELQAGSGGAVDAAWRYGRLGVEHILFGVDHLLFILALLLIVRGWRMLVGTISAFTLAHSVTLGLATLGYVEVASGPVEASIALSIVFVAAEGVRGGRPGLARRQPWVAALGFGLLHGFGFAGALSEAGLAKGEVPVALLFFNIGVEAGQLGFVSFALGVGWAVRRVVAARGAWTRLAPGYAIGGVAMFWLIERVQAMFGGVG